MSEIVRYGVISDTHGTLNPKVFEAFEGVRRIYHCGDVGNQTVVADLETIAPVRAVHGNMDPWPVAGALIDSLVENVEFGVVALCHGKRYGHHNERIVRGLLRLFAAAAPRAILFGHSHQPVIEERDGILVVNPGSASLPQGGLAPTVAVLDYDPEKDILTSRLVALQ